MFEMVISLGIIVVITSAVFVTLGGRESETQIDAAIRGMAATVREAQSRALAQSSSTVWGVHFENATTTTPFYALFSTATYASATTKGRYPLPQGVAYVTSTLGTGSSTEVIFSQITGAASASTTLSIYLLLKSSRVATLSISSSGAVRY